MLFIPCTFLTSGFPRVRLADTRATLIKLPPTVKTCHRAADRSTNEGIGRRRGVMVRACVARFAGWWQFFGNSLSSSDPVSLETPGNRFAINLISYQEFNANCHQPSFRKSNPAPRFLSGIRESTSVFPGESSKSDKDR